MIMIRKPNQDELEEIIRLSPQALHDGTLGNVKPSEEKVRQLVEPILAKGGYYLAALEEGKVIGWIFLGPAKDQFTDERVGFIYELYVHEAYRGKGISKQLMKSGVDHLKQDGYTEIRLSVFAENDAVKLYEKMGFQVRTMTMTMRLAVETETR